MRCPTCGLLLLGLLLLLVPLKRLLEPLLLHLILICRRCRLLRRH